jgi:hypothetical protein
MANTPTLAKYGKCGLQVQSAEGTEASGEAVVWLPLCDSPSLQWQPNPAAIDAADRVEWQFAHMSTGQWWAGGISVYLYPAAVSTLIDIIQTRDSSNQGKFFTVWLIEDNTDHSVSGSPLLVRTCYDAKVRSADFPLAKGPMRVNLDIVAKKDGTKLTPTGYATPLLSMPFVTKDITVVLQAETSSDTDRGYTFKSGSVKIDNQVQDPAEGIRFLGTYTPYTLYNQGAVVCTVDAVRDFSDSDFYTAWRKQYEVGSAGGYDWYDETYDSYMTVTYSRGSSSFTMTLPRLRIDSVNTGMRGSRVGTQDESISFVALADAATGLVKPITLS